MCVRNAVRSMLKRRKTQIKNWRASPAFSTRIQSAVVSARRALEPWLAAFSLLFTGTTRELYRQFQTGGMGVLSLVSIDYPRSGSEVFKAPSASSRVSRRNSGKDSHFPVGGPDFPPQREKPPCAMQGGISRCRSRLDP